MIEKLTKTTKDGKPYKRRVNVESKIKLFLTLESPDLVRRCTDHLDLAPLEVLLYFLRRLEPRSGTKDFESIFKAFFSRLELSLKHSISDTEYGQASTIRDEVLSKFAETLALDKNGQPTNLDYFEINFNSAFKNFCLDVLRKLGPAADKTISLTQEFSENTEIRPEVEAAVLEAFSLNPSILDDSTFRFRLYTAIKKLPDNERRTITLKLQGLPLDSKNPEKQTISKIMKCNERTVRNRLSRAIDILQETISLEEI